MFPKSVVSWPSVKTLSGTLLMMHPAVALNRVVSDFARLNITVLLVTASLEVFANEVFVPSSIAYIVDGVKCQQLVGKHLKAHRAYRIMVVWL